MLIIHIDASQRKDKKVILEKVEDGGRVELAKREGDIDMVAAIKEILEEQKLNLQQIDDFTYVQGSGSFTGIKMAAAIANVLKWSVKKVPFDKLPLPNYGSEPNITIKL